MSLRKPSVLVKYLGLINYAECLQQQNNLVSANKNDAGSSPTLLLLEHQPVYTVGMRGAVYSQEQETTLRNLGADFHRTNRGGLITFHGPGQLVAYPILDLRRFDPAAGVKRYVCRLERTLIETCRRAGIPNAHAPGHPLTGVWVGDAKVAAIGVNVKRYITSHGVALNCNVDLSWFSRIVPCGLEGVTITSVANEVRRAFTIEDAIPLFLNAFGEQFECDFQYDDNFTRSFPDYDARCAKSSSV